MQQSEHVLAESKGHFHTVYKIKSAIECIICAFVDTISFAKWTTLQSMCKLDLTTAIEEKHIYLFVFNKFWIVKFEYVKLSIVFE